MSSKRLDADNEQVVGRLIEAAGRGPTATDAAKQRIYLAVKAEWQNSTRPARVGRSDWHLGWLSGWRLPSAAVAVAALIAVAITYVNLTPESAPGIPVATVVRSIGTYEVRSQNGMETRVGANDETMLIGEWLVTGANDALTLRLVSGIQMRVAANTSIVFGEPDSLEVRSGRIYLDTGDSRADAAAFTVNTRYGSVAHVGTQYMVSVDATTLQIHVREGAVAFNDGRNEYRGQQGEQLSVTGAAPPAISPISITGADWQWVEALAAAPSGAQHRAADLLSWIARETGRELRFASSASQRSAEESVLSGAAGLTPAEALLVIESTTQLRIEVSEDRLVVD